MSIWLQFKYQESSYYIEFDPTTTVDDLRNIFTNTYHIENPEFVTDELVLKDPSKTIQELGLTTGSIVTISTGSKSKRQKSETSISPPKEKDGSVPVDEDSISQDPTNFQSLVSSLMELGFETYAIVRALRTNNYDPNLAYSLLSSGIIGSQTDQNSERNISGAVLLSDSRNLSSSTEDYRKSMQKQYESFTAEEKASVDKIVEAGFSQTQAVEAYLVCEKNEQNTLNFLSSK